MNIKVYWSIHTWIATLFFSYFELAVSLGFYLISFNIIDFQLIVKFFMPIGKLLLISEHSTLLSTIFFNDV